jgi:hypothetical protein
MSHKNFSILTIQSCRNCVLKREKKTNIGKFNTDLRFFADSYLSTCSRVCIELKIYWIDLYVEKSIKDWMNLKYYPLKFIHTFSL